MVLGEENGSFVTMNNRENSHCAFLEMPCQKKTAPERHLAVNLH